MDVGGGEGLNNQSGIQFQFRFQAAVRVGRGEGQWVRGGAQVQLITLMPKYFFSCSRKRKVRTV